VSRVGRMPIEIPKGIEIEQKGQTIIVKNDKGSLEEKIHPEMLVKIENGVVQVERPSESKFHKSLHGLTRTLINNMVEGLTKGFEKKLEIIGVGYKAEAKGKSVILQLGYSHPIYLTLPEGIIIETPTPTSVIVRGVSKHLVGQVADKIRSLRPPEPYKGKGVRYDGEYVRRKAGKATV